MKDKDWSPMKVFKASIQDDGTYSKHCVLDTLASDETVPGKIGDQGSISTATREPCHVRRFCKGARTCRSSQGEIDVDC